MATINNLVIGTIIYLVVINVWLFAMASSYVDNEKIPEFINKPLNESATNEYDTSEGVSILKTMSFGYFINVDGIEETGVRVVLRLILTVIFQLIGILILVFAGLDFVRGI